METEYLRVAIATDRTSINTRPERWRTVKQQLQAVATRYCRQSGVITSDPIRVDPEDGDRSRSNLSLDIFGVEAHGTIIRNGDKDRLPSTPTHGMRCCRKGKRRDDDLTGFDACCSKHRHQGNLPIAKHQGRNPKVLA